MNSKADGFQNAVNAIAVGCCRALLVLAFALIDFADAHAQQTADQAAPATILPGIEVSATPYLWLPWISAGIRPADTRLSSVSDTIGAGKVIDHLTWVPFMGQAEFRSGPYGVVFDYIHAPLKSGISTRNILFGGGTGDFTLNTGSAVFLYRVLALPDQNADIGLGFRAWGLDGEIALNQLRRRLPPVTIANGLSWADPLISGRYHFDFGNGIGATASGDLGGFGVGAHFDWQLVGTIDYALRPGLDLHAGFRSLNFSYGAPRANLNVNMYGPIISATFRF